jgi:hypothetical protein
MCGTREEGEGKEKKAERREEPVVAAAARARHRHKGKEKFKRKERGETPAASGRAALDLTVAGGHAGHRHFTRRRRCGSERSGEKERGLGFAGGAASAAGFDRLRSALGRPSSRRFAGQVWPRHARCAGRLGGQPVGCWAVGPRGCARMAVGRIASWAENRMLHSSVLQIVLIFFRSLYDEFCIVLITFI